MQPILSQEGPPWDTWVCSSTSHTAAAAEPLPSGHTHSILPQIAVHSHENQPSRSPGLHTSHSTPGGSLTLGAKPFSHQTSAQPQLRHTSLFTQAFTDHAQPRHRHTEWWGPLGSYNHVSTQPAESCIPARQSCIPSHTPQTMSAKHTATTCAVFSLLVSSWLTHGWHSTSSESREIHVKETSLTIPHLFWGRKEGQKEGEQHSLPDLGHKYAEDLSTGTGSHQSTESIRLEAALPLSAVDRWALPTHHSSLIQWGPVPTNHIQWSLLLHFLPISSSPHPHLHTFTLILLLIVTFSFYILICMNHFRGHSWLLQGNKDF